jgi:hypothetical protein
MARLAGPFVREALSLSVLLSLSLSLSLSPSLSFSLFNANNHLSSL